jgi:Protein of unknown function (DUF4238)
VPTIRTNQHYVPQFLLRNFASSSGGDQVHVFDKANEKSFSAAINRVASARAFYDYEDEGERPSIDPLLTKLESVTSRVVRNIVQARSLQCLSKADRTLLALFATVQKLRTDARRKQVKALSDSLYDAIKRAGFDPARVRGFDFLSDEEARIYAITSLRELARDLLPQFQNKSWILYSAPEHCPLYISDNPVALFNLTEHPFLSTLGLGVPGIQIYLPLSRDLCLGFLCPTIEVTVRESYEIATSLGHPVPAHVHSFINALNGDGVLALDRANVVHQNSLQVWNAERFVFCSNPEFALILEMLQSVPELRTGPRFS